MKTIFRTINLILIFILLIIVIPVYADVTIPKYDYVINYYKDSISEENLIETIRGKDIYYKEISVDVSYKIPDGYNYIGEDVSFYIKESNNLVNVIYSKKGNLSYCINYFYDGILSINNTECFYEQPFGKEINSFVDKPKEGYVFDSFDPIVVLDIEENIMNVYYKSASTGEIVPPNTRVTYNNIIINIIEFFKSLINSIF